ncbi:ankyrin repeat-containing domain protein [Colletotrichum navitas]|uniref:Ankyrin repeat-containing domain protein n=1 Tax=Colletotrichum navitas TaxID=681940 RepID=A0AAD8Q257_9PEZI|nr:ankyrin repeat-containing domain protein [Colletotrichum navitas]KAK1594103.1 ankyrin repeat-containing domain protein [Colletotrichum navitas]
MVSDQRLWQSLADVQAKTESTYRHIRQPGSHGEIREALRLISGTLHSLSLLFEDLEDADNEAQLACPGYTLIDELSTTLDDLNLAWSTASGPSKAASGPTSLPELTSQIRKLEFQLAPAVQAASWPALLVCLSATGPRKPPQKQEHGVTNKPGLDALDIDPVECLSVLLNTKFGHKLDSCHSHLMNVAKRDITHPEYASCARALPKVALSYYHLVEEGLRMLFHPNKSANFMHWLLEYARQEWPNKFNPKSGAVSMSPLLRLMSIGSDASVSPLHIAAALGLPQLCEHLIILEKQDVNQQSPMGTPLYCALLGPAALLARSADPAQLLTDCRPGGWQESTLNVLLDAGASCALTPAGPQQDEEFSLGTLAFLTCQSIHAPEIMVRILRSQLNLDKRFVQLFHGKDSILQYWPSPLPQLTPSFLAPVLPEILDLAVSHYDSEHDTWSLLATGVYDVMERFDLTGLCSDRGSRPLDISDTVYTNMVREAIQDSDIAVIRRLILDPRWDPNASMEHHSRKRSSSTLDDNAALPKPLKPYTILHYAVEADEANLVSLILDSGEAIDVHVRNQHDQTPLMLSESPEVLKLLLGRGARTTDTDESGRNVWHFAAANSDIDLINVLHEHDEHKDQNLKGLMKNGSTPIAQSIIYPFKLMKRNLNSKPKDPVGALRMLEVCVPNVAYLQSPTPLIFLAAEWCSYELVRKLVDFGADPFEVDNDGRNVLHCLNTGAGEPLVKMLLDLKVEPLLTREGLSPAETMFSFFNNSGLSGSGLNQLFESSRPLDVAAYNNLLTSNVLQSRNSDGAGLWERFAVVVIGTWASEWPSGANAWVSLHNAVQCLIKKRALAKYEEEKGECGLIPVLSSWAKMASSRVITPRCLEEIIFSILQASTKADSFRESKTAVQCLKLAIELDHTDLVAKLLDLRVSIHAPHQGFSAFESAFMPFSRCQPAMFDQLLEHVDVRSLDDDNNFGTGLLYRLLDPRILHSAHKLSAIVRKGCDPNVKTPGGVPIVVAYIKAHRTDSALVLLEAGADPAALSTTGFNAALTAALLGNLPVLCKIQEIDSSFDWEKTCTYDFYGMTDPGVTLKDDCNVLHLAASSGCSEVIQFCLEALDLDVDSQTADGWRPIHFAAASDDGDGSCVRVLLEHGADPTAELPSRGHWDPLSIAARNGCEVVKALLELDSETVNKMNVPGALMAAFQHEDRDVIEPFRPLIHELVKTTERIRGRASLIGVVLELFIETSEKELATSALKMVDPEDVNSIRMSCGECSPLVLAAARGQFAIGEVFLDHGMTTWSRANRCARHSIVAPSLHYPCTALHIALMLPDHIPRQDMKGFVTYLLGAIDWSGHELSPFHCAAIGNVPDRMHMVADWIRESPEHHAKLLRGMRAWPSSPAKGISGSYDPASNLVGTDTPAASESEADVILRHYVNQPVASPDLLPMFRIGQTPLLVAIDSLHCGAICSTEMIEALLRYGADVNLPGQQFSGTPLNEVTSANHLDGARLLLAHGANPNLWASRSSTPLITAVLEGHLEMAQLLVEHGADIHVRSAKGVSLLGVCGERSRDPDMFIWLMGLGLDPYRFDNQGYTPIHEVILRGGFPGLMFNYGFDFSRVRDTRAGFLSLVIEFSRTTANDILKRLFRRLPPENAVQLANSTPETFVSPLCNAVIREKLDCIPTLLRYGARIDVEGSVEGSALMVACAKGNLEAVKALLQHGASISYQTTVDGAPVFRSAVEYARPFPYILHWLLVGRHVRLRGIEGASESAGGAETRPWSGGRVAGYELSGVGTHTGRRSGETSLEYLRRLDRIRWRLRGQVVRVVDLGYC